MSIAAMEWEVEIQQTELARFANQMIKNSPSPIDWSRTVFTGSGDSYATAMFARELTNGSASAEDPYELLSNLARIRGKTVVFVSVSGRTRTNIELARKARGRAKRTIAVTSNKESPLAEICGSSIILEYGKAGPLTSGTASFSASLVACASLLDRLPRRFNVKDSLDDAREWARGARLSRRGLCLFVGSGVDRALAEYGACKVQEVLGLKAFAAYPDQVGHAQLFSLNPALDNVVCISSQGGGKTRVLSENLSKSGFAVHRIFLKGQDVVLNSLAAAFYLQDLALANAKRFGMKECAFLLDKTRLGLSNRLIY